MYKCHMYTIYRFNSRSEGVYVTFCICVNLTSRDIFPYGIELMLLYITMNIDIDNLLCLFCLCVSITTSHDYSH